MSVCKSMCLCTSERLTRLARWLTAQRTVGQMKVSMTTCMKRAGLIDDGLLISSVHKEGGGLAKSLYALRS